MSHIVLQFFNTLEWRGSCYDWSGIYFSKLPGFSSSTLDPLYQNNKCFDDKIRFVYFLVFFTSSKKLANFIFRYNKLFVSFTVHLWEQTMCSAEALPYSSMVKWFTNRSRFYFLFFSVLILCQEVCFWTSFSVTTHLNVNEQILEPSSGLRSGWSRKSIPQVCLKSLCIMEWKQKQWKKHVIFQDMFKGTGK